MMAKIGASVYLKAPIRIVKYIKYKPLGSEFYEEVLTWGIYYLKRNGIIFNYTYLGEGDVFHFKGKKFKIPGSERIIGIHQGITRNFVFIRTEFNLFYLREIDGNNSDDLDLDLVVEQVTLKVRDRILTVLEEHDQLWVVMARGTVQSFKFSQNENKNSFVKNKTYSLVSLSAVFYSAAIVRISNVKLEISFGSIFSGILLTHIDELDSSDTIVPVLNLNGHNGSIFDLMYDLEKTDTLVSCSDDRSIIIWKIDRTANNFTFNCVASCIGHEARIWSLDVRFDRIASASEDNTCRLWTIHGQIIDVFEGDKHSKSIWSVALNSKVDRLSFGSNDGSVLTHNLNIKIFPFITDYSFPEASFGKIKNFAVSPLGITYIITDLDKILRLTKNFAGEIIIKIITEIDNIGTYSKIAISSEYLFIGNDRGILYYCELNSEESSLIFKRIEIISKAKANKISNIYVQSQHPKIVFVELNDHYLYLFDTSSNIINGVTLDSNLKVSSVLLPENKSKLYIGTRQGLLLIFDRCCGDLLEYNLFKTVKVSDMESLKSIRIDKERMSISVMDRLGFEYVILDLNDQIIERKSICNGNFSNYLEKHGFTLSFHQQNFVITSPLGVYQKLFCGGGHRLWSSSSDSQNFAFGFILKNNFSVVQGSLNRTESIAARSHGKEIRCARVLDQHNCLVLSGSEDGLLVLYKDLKPVYDLRLSNVSIKCIASYEDLVFIGGSNESIEVFSYLHQDYAPSSFLLVHVSTCPKQIKEVESRVLSLDCIKNDDDGNIILLAGYSDASIRIFEYKRGKISFRLLATIKKVHNARCVQQIRAISFEKFVLKFISAGTDGVIQGWLYYLTESLPSKVEMIWNRALHESGINSLEIKNFADNGDDNLIILTGGDDGNVSKIILNLKNDKIISVKTRQSHHSAVTSVNFVECHDSTSLKFISSSIDRFILIYDERLEEIEFIRSVISDIAAMTLITKHNQKKITVYGVGQESFSCVF